MKGCLKGVGYGFFGALGLVIVLSLFSGGPETVVVNGVEVTVTPHPTRTPRPSNTPLPTPTPVDWDTVESPEYREFFRYAEDYEGKPVYFEGEVLQVIDDCYRVAVEETEYGWDIDTVVMACGSTNVRILNDDIIRIYGVGDGIQSYDTVLGAEVEVPLIDAIQIELQDQ